MWTRKEVKGKGKAAFKRNYWKAVLVAILFAVISGGMGSSIGSSFGNGFSNGIAGGAMGYKNETNNGTVTHDVEEIVEDEDEDVDVYIQSDATDDIDVDDDETTFYNAGRKFGLVVAITVAVVVFLVVVALIMIVDILVANPLEVGIRRFYTQNLNQEASVKEVVFAYDHNFKNIAKIMFYRDMYTFLWMLLFIIPGIVKAYEYRMIPYLLAENPAMNKEEVFALSKQMMNGQKWKAFVLDLSFIGWGILGAVTCGILNIFYVHPYIFSTEAALYETLKYEN